MSTSQIIADRFEISDLEKDLLGRGGMGDVYWAIDTQTGEPVAVKALSPGVVARDPDILERFVREGQALRQLNHPNIVGMVAAVEEEGQHYLIMQYVEGGSLQDLLAAQGPLHSTRVVEIALDLADALTRAHRLGIIHRDLKPANVLLAEDGTPRLTDFGIAHVADSPRLTETGILVGTVDYLSPEACNGEPLDERTDIWAFGVLLYEMLTGERPFVGETLTAKLTAILTQLVPDLAQLCPDVPDALADLVYRMLEKDRQQRVPSVRLVGAELEAILKGWEVPTPMRLAPAESRFAPPTPPAQPPSFLEEGEPLERPVFVARERELAQLDGYLNTALAGQGRVVFVTGDPGQGKTALVQEFAWRAQAAHPDLVVAGGNCNAHTGIGDPYLPFREILGLLTGDVEERWAARAISQEQARRLWHTLPLAVQALVEAGPDLIDLFVSGAALVKRAVAFAPGRADWLPRLEELVKRKATAPGDPNLQQSALFEQYTRVLGALAGQRPLLLVLDDLQWADGGSTSLLFHLGRRIEGSRVLIVGTYRPAEVALGRGGERHPLESVVNEFKRQFGEIEVDLGQAEDRQFIEAFLDTEPNRLGDAFRRTLYRQTRGHPFSTIELLRDMQERGDLLQDGEGRWVEGPALDWEILPTRVEAVIAERMSRLAEPAREALQVASIEGEAFTAEVVAQVLGADERETVRWLSKLDREHRLVSAQGIRRVNGQRLSLYRFRHILFQRYLYNSLGEGERAYLHEDVGTALEGLYGETAEEIAAVAPQLARHFQEAGMAEKAVAYLLQAGNRAARLSAHEEAVAHFRRGLELLQALPDTPERARQEIALRIYLAAVLVNLRGYADTEVGQAYERAYELCERIGETLRMATVAHGLFMFYLTRAEYGPALEMAERLLSIASKKKSRLMRLVGDTDLAFVILLMGELDKSLKHAEQAIASYSPHLHRLTVQEGGVNAGVVSWSLAGVILQLLGHPDQSRRRLHEALAMARDVAHPYTLAAALFFSALASQLRRDAQTTQGHTTELATLSTEYGFQMFLACGITWQGRTIAVQGQATEGVAQIRQGLAMLQAMGTAVWRSYFLSLLAEVYKEAGQLEEGLAALNDGIVFVERTGERFYEAELHRLKGELLWMEGQDEAEVEGYYQHAIEVARRQSAKWLELRAVMSLSRLWQKQGKREEARQRLAEIYGWFTEGFDTPDLQEAKALLEELS